MSVRGGYVEVRGADAIHRALAPLLQPELDEIMWRTTRKAAQQYAKALRSETKPASRTMAGAVRYYKAKRDRPGYVVGYRRRKAFFAHWVIGGTRDHGPKRASALVFIPGFNAYLGASSHGVGRADGGGGWVRARRVSGVRPNPIVERAGDKAEGRVSREMEQQFVKETGL